MRYQVTHRTTYTYDDDVTDSLGVAYVTPRDLPWQQVHDASLTVSPQPSDVTRDLDFYGNAVTFFQVTAAHRRLELEARSLVDVVEPVEDDTLLTPWEDAVPSRRTDLPDAWQARDLALASPYVELTSETHAYAAVSLQPGRPVGEAVTDLVHRLHADFRYEPGVTTVTSTIPEILAARAGVCQDFAHLALSCLRSHGLAARYVSGYLATDPPPGRDRVVGADATHAWVAVWVPGGAWLAVDPTNDQRAGDRYVTVAWGRDYGDVPPVKGVIFTDASESRLVVEVDVAPL